MQVTVLGSGTSAGIPVIGCDCPVCSSTDPRNKRLRTSIMLRDERRTIVVDTGADFREQALRYAIKRLDAVLVTHAHSDHVNGVDEIRLYNWRQGHPIPMYASPTTWANLRRRFDYIFTPQQIGGGVPQLTVHELDNDQPFEVQGLRVVPLPIYHGQLPVLGFRLGDFAYITDASLVPDETLERLRGVRFLILNALRHKPHPTHLTVEQATELAGRIGPERTWFIHMTHDLDHAETNAGLPDGVELAYDGLTFTITAEEAPGNGAAISEERARTIGGEP